MNAMNQIIVSCYRNKVFRVKYNYNKMSHITCTSFANEVDNLCSKYQIFIKKCTILLYLKRKQCHIHVLKNTNIIEPLSFPKLKEFLIQNTLFRTHFLNFSNKH